MSTNIFRITTEELPTFLQAGSPGKVIVYRKPDCGFCSAQIGALREPAKAFRGGIDFAFCDITGKTDFCREHSVSSLPTTEFYRNGALLDRVSGFLPHELVAEKLRALGFDPAAEEPKQK